MTNERIFRNIDLQTSDAIENNPDEQSVCQMLSLNSLDYLLDLSPEQRDSILKQVLMDEIRQAVSVVTKNKYEVFFIEE